MSKEDNNLSPNKRSPKSRTLFKDTLTRALLENDPKQLRMMCQTLIGIANDGSLPLNERLKAIDLIMNRVDGRPAQAIEINEGVELPSAGQFKIVKVEPANE